MRSAVPLKVWVQFDLNPNTKPKRCRPESVLWTRILSWTPAKNEFWLQRCIGTYVRKLKEKSNRLAPKTVNLKTMGAEL